MTQDFDKKKARLFRGVPFFVHSGVTYCSGNTGFGEAPP